jgi:hypothetical protein
MSKCTRTNVQSTSKVTFRRCWEWYESSIPWLRLHACSALLAINSGTWSFRQTSSSHFCIELAPGRRPTDEDWWLLDSGPKIQRWKETVIMTDQVYLGQPLVRIFTIFDFIVKKTDQMAFRHKVELRMRCPFRWPVLIFFSVCHVHSLLCIESHNSKYKDSIYIVP